MGKTKTSAIIAAAGSGTRFNSNNKKQFELLSGKPVLYYSLNTLQNCKIIDEIVLVVNDDDIEWGKENIVKKYSITKVSKIIPGGKERQLSVKKGFDSLSSDTDLVFIHDAARPFITSDLIDKVVNNAKNNGSAILAIKAKDTLKLCEENNLEVEKTLPRNSVWHAQTPQVFKYEILENGYSKIDITECELTDESQLAEISGCKVNIVEGSELNIKITTREDLKLAESIIDSGLLNND